MQRLTLEVDARGERGKSAVRKLRRAGRVPGVLYGRGIEPLAISVDARAVEAALQRLAGANVLLDVLVREDGHVRTELAMLQDVQRDVLTRRILHVDLHRVSLTEKVYTRLPVRLKGEPPGVREGGILEFLRHEVEVTGLPTDLPDHLELDVSRLALGDSLHVRDLKVPPGVTVLTPPEETLVTVLAPAVAPEEAPAAAEEVPAQPEVVGKGKAAEEGEE
ncbi:MAG: 50S ribosomal protein L25 [Armatimonadota bacterium]|nr:50S ribosomal protein L25 [Armatimonadota bacterium]MDR7600048.1 50S ribosomal protein L25 [Armatimonadota bacterium]